MKKTKFFTIFAAAIIIFSACSKDSSDKFEDLSKYKFADESADKGKAALENSGQQLMTHMTNMQSLAAMDVMESMMHYLESGSIFTDEFDLFLNNFTSPVQDLTTGENLPILKSTDYDNPGEAFRANAGIYTWNNSLEDWEKVGTSNKIELRFPSVPEGLTNDATAIFDYKGKAARTMPGEELPELLSFSLLQNSNQLISYKLTASYNSDDMPTNVKSDVTIENYTFSAGIKYGSKDISVEYSLKENSNTIIELKLNAKGDFDPDNILMGYYDDDPSEFIDNANVSLQIADIKILGQANVKRIADAHDRIYKDEELPGFDDLAAATQMAKVYNDNAKLIVVYADSNIKFAETEFYVAEDTWWGEHYVDLQLIFADDSRGDFEAYFNSAFEEIIEEILRILEELGIDFDDWDDWNDDDWDDWDW